jgi:hypothetical protein
MKYSFIHRESTKSPIHVKSCMCCGLTQVVIAHTLRAILYRLAPGTCEDVLFYFGPLSVDHDLNNYNVHG